MHDIILNEKVLAKNAELAAVLNKGVVKGIGDQNRANWQVGRR